MPSALSVPEGRRVVVQSEKVSDLSDAAGSEVPGSENKLSRPQARESEVAHREEARADGQRSRS